ncbi:MAG: hypothetical protein F6K09_00405 [Merismopedia sp. SIO2A8]|nr:hypothetical protein [Merismopedia sp. SIO2A8]
MGSDSLFQLSEVQLFEGRGGEGEKGRRGEGEKGRRGEGEKGRNYSSGSTFIRELRGVVIYSNENCYET